MRKQGYLEVKEAPLGDGSAHVYIHVTDELRAGDSHHPSLPP